eukprot:6561-Chlamydomonas_euryale.AAC.1
MSGGGDERRRQTAAAVRGGAGSGQDEDASDGNEVGAGGRAVTQGGASCGSRGSSDSGSGKGSGDGDGHAGNAAGGISSDRGGGRAA